MTVGLALIARDEERQLPRLLRSIEGAFDQVVLVDTGSRDKTLDVFETWAAEEAKRHPGFTGVSAEGKWVDDFAAARRAAHNLLETDWECWADCDDEIVGAHVIRPLCQQAPRDLAAYVCGYDYGQDPATGRCVCYLRRERIVRKGAGHWTGRVHEAQVVNGPVQQVDDALLVWKHRKAHGQSNKRNLRILRKWHRDEPDNPRVVMYLGAESMAQGKPQRAASYFRRYLKLHTTWDEERAQQHRRLSMCLMALDDLTGAERSAHDALNVKPSWPDSYLTLAQVAYQRGQHARAIEWADRCIALGLPETLLIINPLDYTAEPLKAKAGALAALGQLEAAVEAGKDALALIPADKDLAESFAGWQHALETRQMAETFARLARYLVSRDEQEKAARLLTCVPRIADRHALVNEARGWVYDRVAPLFDAPAAYYQAGNGAGPNEPLTIENGNAFASRLPRAGVAVEGILEQLGLLEDAAA